MHVQPYLFFEGRCEEAIEFYKKSLGATVNMLMRYKDGPPPPPDQNCAPPNPNAVMHANIRVGDSEVNCSDGQASGKQNFQGFGLALTVASTDDAQQKFGALSDGGRVLMPLAKTFFSPSFGMVADKFGVMWMVLVQGQK